GVVAWQRHFMIDGIKYLIYIYGRIDSVSLYVRLPSVALLRGRRRGAELHSRGHSPASFAAAAVATDPVAGAGSGCAPAGAQQAPRRIDGTRSGFSRTSPADP